MYCFVNDCDIFVLFYAHNEQLFLLFVGFSLAQGLHPGLCYVAPSVLGGVSISSFYSNLYPFSQIREIGIICWRRCVWDSMSDAILSEQMFSTLPTRAPSAVCLDAVLCMLMTPQRLL